MQHNLIVQLDNANIYQKGQKVLGEVNLRISKGEFAYLIGKTGSGKSSLLKTLYGDLPLTEGRGQVAGFDLSKLDRHNIPFLRRKLGIVFQDFNLLSDRTVAENLLFVLRATDWQDKWEMNSKVDEALSYVGLQDKIDKMPHQLSGGEQQRVVIARALLNNPELIIADEPTGNLDPETSDELLILMRKLAEEQNTAILFATHDYRILENFPAAIIRCINGRIINEEEVRL
ncbi:MAG: ATP-binding cassette domain-containing protein [Saprospiraceae bacterium]|nr:ATP-binding cassette domain-containing protein [Saprospiraceae bacterium]MCB9323136.1 ATP-binding cassette domain-containing protein [Lewinellaceae bacterium]